MVLFSFWYLSFQKKVINKKHIPENDMFFTTSGAKTIELRSNLIAKRCKNMKRAHHCFFQILLSYHTFGDNSVCLRKNNNLFKISPLVTSDDLNIELT